ncbi:hypothetical protein Cni_G06450 [Canna indica]|uniref:Uncharacterized protein n=1 Tax=Canna indica TaxID=4628 RepID=A0AAQ3JZD3_9LILI|nr:hypothetical protein Cni_G06450 [Canna indica]
MRGVQENDGVAVRRRAEEDENMGGWSRDVVSGDLGVYRAGLRTMGEAMKVRWMRGVWVNDGAAGDSAAGDSVQKKARTRVAGQEMRRRATWACAVRDSGWWVKS